MEKVIIKSVVDTGKKYKDNSIIKVELEDGRKGSAFTADALKWAGEMELEVKEGREYEGQKQYIFNAQKQQQSSKFPVKDYTFDKRNASLTAAINSIKLTEQKVASENIIALAEKYFTYLNQK